MPMATPLLLMAPKSTTQARIFASTTVDDLPSGNGSGHKSACHGETFRYDK